MRNSVDLFTGIGGFALAVHDLFTPIVYCDRDPRVQAILTTLMDRKALARAPVIDDVRNTAEIVAAVAGRRVDLVTAGFPCTGVSRAGLMKGLLDPATSLFFEAKKVVAALKPAMVMFENVGDITKSADLQVILLAMTKLGYSCRWTVCSGLDVRAPQVRRRWFCLCVRKGAAVDGLVMTDTARMFPAWTSRTMPALVIRHAQPDFVARYFVLGNSIIPLAARLAFARLVSGFTVETIQDLRAVKTLALQPPRAVLSAKHGDHGYTVPHGGAVHFDLAAPQRRSFTIRLDPTHFSTHRVTDAMTRAVPGPLVRATFPTPRATNGRLTRGLTERSVRDLGTFAMFASEINGVPLPKTMEGDRVNIRLVEWLMGFPLDYTRSRNPQQQLQHPQDQGRARSCRAQAD